MFQVLYRGTAGRVCLPFRKPTGNADERGALIDRQASANVHWIWWCYAAATAGLWTRAIAIKDPTATLRYYPGHVAVGVLAFEALVAITVLLPQIRRPLFSYAGLSTRPPYHSSFRRPGWFFGVIASCVLLALLCSSGTACWGAFWFLVSFVLTLLLQYAAQHWTLAVLLTRETGPSSSSDEPAVDGRILGRGLRLRDIVVGLVLLTGFAVPTIGAGFAYPAAWFPAAGYLVVLGISLAWILPWVSLCLDQWRVPTEIAVFSVWLVTHSIFESHYLYPVYDTQWRPSNRPPVAAAFEARIQHAPKADGGEARTIVVVAASGGGITAAAWTARVLTGLQQELGSGFAEALTLVSASSGGGVGAMHYVGGYHDGTPPDTRRVMEEACRPTLKAALWGLAYPDFFRLLFGFWIGDKYSDRGSALEHAWATPALDGLRLVQDWGPDLAGGTRPTLAFNATAVETGARVVFSGAQPPNSAVSGIPGDRDIRVTTAARLSATFPGVSPAAVGCRVSGASCSGNLGRVHIVDGGYYDASGVLTAVEWVKDYLIARDAKPRESQIPLRVVFISIRVGDRCSTTEAAPGVFSLPQCSTEGSSSKATACCVPPLESRALDHEPMVGLGSPALTMLAVRGESQVSRNALELELLQNWPSEEVEFSTLEFALPTQIGGVGTRGRIEMPLSWKLTAQERRAIDSAWEVERRAAASRLRAYFPTRHEL